jgi:hypothetical protein
MNLALKEWASVVAAMEAGKQILLLRKGGIVEADRGGFRIKHREFLLFPTFEHQHAASLKPEWSSLIAPPAELIDIRLVCEATDVFPAPPLERLKLAQFIWNDAFLQMRYDYRPDLPLTVILLRARRLHVPQLIPDRPSYAGCKSWVHLTEEIETADAEPVLADEDYDVARRSLLDVLGFAK